MKAPLFRFLRDLAAGNLGLDRRPFRVILMLTARCPHRCRTCGIWKSPPPPDPALPEIRRFFAANPFSWVNLTGGEIVLREDLPEVMHAVAAGAAVPAVLTFPTTGCLPERTEGAARAALEAGIPRVYVTVSFDGPPPVHDRLRGRAGAFEKAEETFRRLRELERRRPGRFRVVPGLTLSAPLLETCDAPLEGLVKALRLPGPGAVHLNLAHTSPHYYRNEGDPPSPSLTAARPILLRAAGARKGLGPADLLERAYLRGALRRERRSRPPLPCRAARASLFVDAEWNAFPCTGYPRPLGNLRAVGFEVSGLRERGGLPAARREIAEGACPGCWTPCEAYTSMLCALFRPSFLRLSIPRPGACPPGGRDLPRHRRPATGREVGR